LFNCSEVNNVARHSDEKHGHNATNILLLLKVLRRMFGPKTEKKEESGKTGKRTS
jgi:hypothetical protein